MLEWTLVSECPIPQDVNSLLVKGEEAIAAYKTFRDSAVFTNKRLIVRDAQGLTGTKVEIGFPNEPENDTQEETWYDGQYAAGESKIYDVQAYNDDKYGTAFKYRSEHSIRAASFELTSYLDSDLTLYYRFENYKMYYPKIDDYTCGYMIGKFIAFKINHLNYKKENRYDLKVYNINLKFRGIILWRDN